MPRFLITRPIMVIRSAGRAARAPHDPDEPRRARRARTAGQRKIAVSLALLITWFILHALNTPELLQVAAYMTTFSLLTIGVQQVGWASGFTARHNTTSIVTVDLDQLEQTDEHRR